MGGALLGAKVWEGGGHVLAPRPASSVYPTLLTALWSVTQTRPFFSQDAFPGSLANLLTLFSLPNPRASYVSS